MKSDNKKSYTSGKHLLLLFFFLFIFLIYNRWIFNNHILSFGDWPYHSEIFLKEFLPFPTLWEGFSNLGRVDLIPAFDPFKVIFGLISKFFSYGISERIIYLFPIAFITPLSSFFLVRHLEQSKFSSVIASIVYSFNTYFLGLQTGHLTLMAAFSLGPTIFLYYKKYLNSESYFDAIICCLLSLICTLFEPRSFFVIIISLVLYLLFYELHLTAHNTPNALMKVKTLLFSLLFLFTVILLNFFWIFALSKIGELSSNEIIDRELWGSQYYDLKHSIALSHPFWTGMQPTTFVVQPIPYYFWLIPIFAFAGFWVNRKNKDIAFFAIVALIGILLTKQVDEPFPGLYPWLFEHVPGFNAFREASKFYFLIALGYSVLIGSFVDWLWTVWVKKGTPQSNPSSPSSPLLKNQNSLNPPS